MAKALYQETRGLLLSEQKNKITPRTLHDSGSLTSSMAGKSRENHPKNEGFLPGLITAIICLRHSKLIGFKEV
jgi:hypothetical protein